MDYKPWPKWIESGYCVHPGGEVEKMKVINHGLLKDFVKNNYIGDVIEVSKYNKYDDPLFNLNRNKCLKISTREKFVDYKSIPDDTFSAKITRIYCGKRTWRIEADLIDFKLLVPEWDYENWDKPPTYSEHKIGIYVDGFPDTIKQIIGNHTQLQRESEANRDAITRRSAEAAHNYAMLNRGEINEDLFKPGLGQPGWGRETGSGGGGKKMRKSKKRRRSSRNYKSKKRKRSSRNRRSKRRR